MTTKKSHILLMILIPVLASFMTALLAFLISGAGQADPQALFGLWALYGILWFILAIVGFVIFFKKGLRSSLIYYGASLAAVLLMVGGCFATFR